MCRIWRCLISITQRSVLGSSSGPVTMIKRIFRPSGDQSGLLYRISFFALWVNCSIRRFAMFSLRIFAACAGGLETNTTSVPSGEIEGELANRFRGEVERGDPSKPSTRKISGSCPGVRETKTILSSNSLACTDTSN